MSKSEGNNPVANTEDVSVLLAVLSGRHTKGEKEAALRRIREIERRDGVEIYGGYNGK